MEQSLFLEIFFFKKKLGFRAVPSWYVYLSWVNQEGKSALGDSPA